MRQESILTAIFVLFIFVGRAQEYEVSYLKTFPFESYLNSDKSGALYNLGFNSLEAQVDVGILNQDIAPLDSDYFHKNVFYDSSFQIIDLLELQGGGTRSIFKTHKVADDFYATRPSTSYGGSMLSSNSGITSDDFVSSFTAFYDTSANDFSLFSSISIPNLNMDIIPFSDAYYSFNVFGATVLRNPTVVVDDKIIEVHNLFGPHTILSEEFNQSLQYGFLWRETSLMTGEVETTQVNQSEAGGSVLSYGLFPSSDLNSTYHIYLVRGNNTEISAEGDVFETSPADSLYHFRIRKDGPDLSWDTRLMSYNNDYADSLPGVSSSAYLNSLCRVDDFLDQGDNLYLSMQKVLNYNFQAEEDTILVVDFKSDTVRTANTYTYFIPDISIPQTVDYAEFSIFKINLDGQVQKEMNFLSNVFHLSTSGSKQTERRRLHPIGDNMVTTFQYEAQSDTTFQFVSKYPDAPNDSSSLALPAGRGVVLLFFDQELEIVDHWIIPYEGAPGSLLQIYHLSEIGEDSLLLHGNIELNISSSLDPFGNLETQTFESNSSFIALLTNNSTTSTNQGSQNSSFEVYPNPSDGLVFLNLPKSFNPHYFALTDLQGRLCAKGVFDGSDRWLDLSDQNGGMYILSLSDNEKTVSRKVVLD
jgi:hypothetical protein